MVWSEPKTDWIAEDYFNVADYNRIIGNLGYLKALAAQLFPDFSISHMGAEKTYADYIYAREINTIETNLALISQNTYGFNLGETTTYKTNGNTPLWTEFNRIERAILLLYKTMTAHKAALPKLMFTLSREKGVKV